MLERITIGNGFDEVFAIMDESFPKTEYRPYHRQKELFSDSAYGIYVKRDKGEIIGFAAVWDFDEVLFIEHLAVSPKRRNGGIGGELLREITSGTKKRVCLEVEPPEDDITKRRVAFYERNGFVRNPYPYIQPSVAEGRPPVPLIIMTSGGTVDESEYKRMKSVIYKRVYKCFDNIE